MKESDKQFIRDVKYFWNEKGDAERLIGFSVEKLKKVSPDLGKAYEEMKYKTKVFETLLEKETESL